MSVLHPAPGRREIQNPFLGLSPPPSPLWIATLFLNLNSGVTVLQFSGVGGFLCFLFFFFFPYWLCVRMLWSDIWHEYSARCLVTSSKRGGVIATLGKVLYNNGLIFLFRENLPPHVCFFSFLPRFLSLAVDGLFCIHADYVPSLFHLVNWKLLLNQTAVCLLYLRPPPPSSLALTLAVSNVTFYSQDQYGELSPQWQDNE